MKRLLVVALLLARCAPISELARVDVVPSAGDAIAVPDAKVFDVWEIPGRDLHLVFAERPAVDHAKYGPQLFVIAKNGDVLFESVRMMDTAFVEPSFFLNGSRMLMLANHGNEDSWGLIAMAFDEDRIRDLGDIDVVRPPAVAFDESALPLAHVFVDSDRYVVAFDELDVVFEESNGRFVRSRRTRSRGPR